MFEKEEFSDWLKENTPKEGLSENTTFTKQFVIDAWNNGYNKAKEELEKAKDIIYQLLMIGKFQFDFCDAETNYYSDCIVKNAEDFIKPKEYKE